MRITRILACLPLLASLGGCLTENPFAEYFHRTDTIKMDAGDAQNVNIATQTIDPWPRHVGNRRIPADAERMGAAVQKTHRPSQGAGGAGGGGGAAGGAGLGAGAPGAGGAGGAGAGAGSGAGTGTTGGTATSQ
jgi:hypothetical protein